MERWKPVVKYEGFYEVSDLGRVRSLPRKGTAGGIRKTQPDMFGYPTLNLCKHGVQTRVKIHHLVLAAFVGPRPQHTEARHYPDRTPANCKLRNLQWSSRITNMKDKVGHGTHNRGERCGGAKLTLQSVREIRRLRAIGTTRLELSQRFGVSTRQIHMIHSGRSWQHDI